MPGKWTEQTQNSGREDGKCWTLLKLFLVVLWQRYPLCKSLKSWNHFILKRGMCEELNTGTNECGDFCQIFNKGIMLHVNSVLSALP